MVGRPWARPAGERVGGRRRRPAAALSATLALTAVGCLNLGGVDLSPAYRGESLVVPARWAGASPFVEANPADHAIRQDWWRLFGDPVLGDLIERALAESPDLQAAAERFVQARDQMMRARSRFVPRLGAEAEASDNRQSADALFRPADAPLADTDVSLGAAASWELDFWSRLRNRARQGIYEAQEVAAQYALARLSLQAELATAYFTLRGLDAQEAIYRQSVDYYQQSLDLVTVKFRGLIAADLDVARAQYQLSSTQARHLGIRAQRQVVEHAIAVLVNAVPALFSIAPVDVQTHVGFTIPNAVPSTLLERRADIAAMERTMARANKGIGIARAAFFPNVPLGAAGGIAGHVSGLFKVPNFFWSIGAFLRLPLFDGGHRRADLQRAWSAYRETESRYRATVLNAFREVEDGLSLSRLAALEVARQDAAVEAAWRQQNLSMELYKGGLASSLELISAQVNTLEARLMATEVKANLARASVGLIRALGGGWSRDALPGDDEIQPFGVLQYTNLARPEPAGGIDVTAPGDPALRDMTRPANF